ncbi:MAG: hypothetical protein GX616_06380 [Planctomycetes bacterium]|nr:hypothetical protein [Planctomycetota bacterium]
MRIGQFDGEMDAITNRIEKNVLVARIHMTKTAHWMRALSCVRRRSDPP